jgi:hypothetical protein
LPIFYLPTGDTTKSRRGLIFVTARSKKRKGNPCGKGDVFFHLMWQKFLFPFLYCHILVLCLGHELGEIDIDLRKKHGLENSTQITQETLQRIIAGAERGDRGMKIHEI